MRSILESHSQGFVHTVEVVAKGSGSPIVGADVHWIVGTERSLRFVLGKAIDYHEVVARTDATGRAEVRGVMPGIHQLLVRADGYPNWTAEVRVADRDDTRRIELAAGGVVHGTVTRTDDGPIEGAMIFLNPRRPSGLRRYLYTREGVPVAADGLFRVESVPAGRHYVAVIARDGATLVHGNKTAVAIRVVESGEHHLDLAIPTPATLRGRVLGADGVPVGGADLHVSHVDLKLRHTGYFRYSLHPRLTAVIMPKTVTAADGSFEFPAVRAETWRPLTLRVKARGYLKQSIDIRPVAGQTHIVNPVLALLSGRIAGRLSTAEGAPVVGVSVGAWEMQGEKLGKFFVTVSDAEGKFELRMPEQLRNFRVYPILRGDDPWVSTPSEMRGVACGTMDLAFELAPKAYLAGRVSDRSGIPVKDYEFFGFDDTGYERLAEISEGEGRFRIPFPPGRYEHVVIAAPGFVPQRVTEPAIGDELVVVLERAPDLRGRVLDVDGNGIPGAHICLATLDSAAFPKGSKYTPRAMTGADGRFVLVGTPLGAAATLLIHPNRDGAPLLIRRALDQSANTSISIHVPRAHRIEVRFETGRGEPVRGRVLVIDERGWPLDPRIEPALKKMVGDRAKGLGELVGGRCVLDVANGDYTLILVLEKQRFETFPLQVEGPASRRFTVR